MGITLGFMQNGNCARAFTEYAAFFLFFFLGMQDIYSYYMYAQIRAWSCALFIYSNCCMLILAWFVNCGAGNLFSLSTVVIYTLLCIFCTVRCALHLARDYAP